MVMAKQDFNIRLSDIIIWGVVEMAVYVILKVEILQNYIHF